MCFPYKAPTTCHINHFCVIKHVATGWFPFGKHMPETHQIIQLQTGKWNFLRLQRYPFHFAFISSKTSRKLHAEEEQLTLSHDYLILHWRTMGIVYQCREEHTSQARRRRYLFYLRREVLLNLSAFLELLWAYAQGSEQYLGINIWSCICAFHPSLNFKCEDKIGWKHKFVNKHFTCLKLSFWMWNVRRGSS